jgi:hypothetical protein
MMGDGTDQNETRRSQIVEYEAWLETLYILHVPFEEQEDRVGELIGDCYYSMMDVSISERCEIQVKLIPEGKGDPRFMRKQFGVLGWVPDEDGDYDYLIIDRIGVEELVADDPNALKRNVYARLLDGFNIRVVD